MDVGSASAQVIVGVGQYLQRKSPFVVGLGMAAARAATLPNRGRAVRRYLETEQVRRLSIGSGLHVRPGWLSTDLVPVRRGVVPLDACKRFPLPNASFDRIYSEHMIEHLTYMGTTTMLCECRRVLRSGGVLRVATPDLARFVGLLAGDPTPLEEEWVRWSNSSDRTVPAMETGSVVHAFNRMMREWGHTFIYDEDTLTRLLGRCGFTQIERVQIGQSEFPELRGLERHGERIGDACNEIETMVLEARVP